MKRTVIAIAVGLIATSTLAGCVVAVGDDIRDSNRSPSSWEVRQEGNRDSIARLNVGASYNQVLDTMGTPDFTEHFKAGDNDYQVLYYQTNRKHKDGKITKDECTPLLFLSHKLQGWGQSALAPARAKAL